MLLPPLWLPNRHLLLLVLHAGLAALCLLLPLLWLPNRHLLILALLAGPAALRLLLPRLWLPNRHLQILALCAGPLLAGEASLHELQQLLPHRHLLFLLRVCALLAWAL